MDLFLEQSRSIEHSLPAQEEEPVLPMNRATSGGLKRAPGEADESTLPYSASRFSLPRLEIGVFCASSSRVRPVDRTRGSGIGFTSFALVFNLLYFLAVIPKDFPPQLQRPQRQWTTRGRTNHGLDASLNMNSLRTLSNLILLSGAGAVAGGASGVANTRPQLSVSRPNLLRRLTSLALWPSGLLLLTFLLLLPLSRSR